MLMMQKKVVVACCVLVAVARALDIRSFRVNAAKLSLRDAKWRRRAARSTRGIRVEGEVETAVAYVRRVRRLAAELLDEEEFRAKNIVASAGSVVRPLDAPLDVRGPLGRAEAALVAAFEAFARRPLEVAQNCSSYIRTRLAEIVDSEKTRSAARLRRRPLDSPPSALGALEAFADGIVREERGIASQYRATKQFRRPLDAPPGRRGPLASLEAIAETASSYERRRLEALRENGLVSRPMESDPGSPLGRAESVSVGLWRGPILLAALYARILELLKEQKQLISEENNDKDPRQLGS